MSEWKFATTKKPLPPEAKNWPWLKTDECGRPTGLFVKVHGRWRRVGKSRKTVQ